MSTRILTQHVALEPMQKPRLSCRKAHTTTPPGPAPTMARPLAAELLGTFGLVTAGCGSAVLAAGQPDVGIGCVGVALACGSAW